MVLALMTLFESFNNSEEGKKYLRIQYTILAFIIIIIINDYLINQRIYFFINNYIYLNLIQLI